KIGELSLPDVKLLPEETYPTEGKGSVSGTEVGQLETEAGEKIVWKEMTFSLEIFELSSLGPMLLTLSDAREKNGTGGTCATTGDPAGVVLIPSEWHVIDTSTSPLTVALLVLFKEAAITCSKQTVKLRGPVILKVEKVTSGMDITSFGLVSNCTAKGKQELTGYLNDEGTTINGVLSEVRGGKGEASCMRLSLELVVGTSKMIAVSF
ncbi:MAG TPA: hypothetical protein VMB05_15525, partial [Solirubrobacteraceae bacterium]|nr:hypothetical protein [Solirubrobacteraceae bacterium]